MAEDVVVNGGRTASVNRRTGLGSYRLGVTHIGSADDLGSVHETPVQADRSSEGVIAVRTGVPLDRVEEII